MPASTHLGIMILGIMAVATMGIITIIIIIPAILEREEVHQRIDHHLTDVVGETLLTAVLLDLHQVDEFPAVREEHPVVLVEVPAVPEGFAVLL